MYESNELLVFHDRIEWMKHSCFFNIHEAIDFIQEGCISGSDIEWKNKIQGTIHKAIRAQNYYDNLREFV